MNGKFSGIKIIGRMAAAGLAFILALPGSAVYAAAQAEVKTAAAIEDEAKTPEYLRRIRKAGGDDASGQDGSGTQEAGTPEAGEQPEGMSNADGGIRLTEEELEELSGSLSYTDNGFFLSTYTRPEEIGWSEVFYNGAGIALGEEDPGYWYVREHLEEDYGELVTSLFVLKIPDIRGFVYKKTGMDYREALRPVELESSWQWFDMEGLVASLHGDTNFQQITFTKGFKEGDLYRLYYTVADPEHSFEPRDFIVTAKIEYGEWQFVSNVPASADAPAQLARIDFYPTREEAAAAAGSALKDELQISYDRHGDAGTIDYLDGEGASSYQVPEHFAVVTALADGVSLNIDEEIIAGGGTEMYISLAGVDLPNYRVASYKLDEGEAVIFNAAFTFEPVIRVSACDGVRYGDYWIGDDNFKYIDYNPENLTRTRIITGYAQGLYPQSDADLSNALAGTWVYLDPAEGKPKAIMTISRFRDMEIYYIEHSGWTQMWMGYQRTFAGPSRASDTVTLRVTEDGTGFIPEGLVSSVSGAGDYLVTLRQEDNARILNLRQLNNGDGVLSYLLSGEEETAYDFDFYRYTGRQTWKTEYKRVLEETRIDAELQAESEFDDMLTPAFDSWHLYDINKDGVPELIIKRGSFEADYRLEVYTIDEEGNAVLCTPDGSDEPVWFGHAGLYSYPDGNGALIWEGHMGVANIRRMALNGTVLSQQILLEEDINMEEAGEDARYTEPGEFVPGSVRIEYFYPPLLLPVDTYESWAADAGLVPDESAAAEPAAAAPDETGMQEATAAAAAKASVFGYDEPDWFHDVQNTENTTFIVCPASKWMNDPGTMTVGDFLNQGVIYEYSPDNLIVQHLIYADLDGDDMAEAIMYIGASDSQASQYRAIFHRQDGKTYAYTDLLYSEETLEDDGTFVSDDPYDTYRKKAVFDRNQCFFYEVH